MTTHGAGISPLSRAPGFRLIITQQLGGHPAALIDCDRCPWQQVIPLEADMRAELLGQAVAGAIGKWASHVLDENKSVEGK